MIARHHRRNSVERNGSVLLAVLVIVVLLTLAAFQYSELMMAEYRAADSSWKQLAARSAAESGVHYAAGYLSNVQAFTGNLSANPYNNQAMFANIPVGNALGANFSIIAPVPVDSSSGTGPTSFQYGVIDESSKINLNGLLKIDSTGQAAHDLLMKLPNMTEDIADSIVDWLDPDDDPRTNGAESSYYEALIPPYRCKNGPLDSLEELLQVKGVTPQLLFGTDYNHNGMQDPGEDVGNGWDPGWSAYLTVYSRERNVDNSGASRLFLNDTDLATQHTNMVTALGQPLADFITLYRTQTSGTGTTVQMTATMQGGKMVMTATTTTSRAATSDEIATKIAEVTGTGSSTTAAKATAKSLASRYELIDASISWTVGTGRNQTSVQMKSPLVSTGGASQLGTLLPTLLDKTTTQQLSELPARLNINTAQRAALMLLPGTTDTEVQSILDNQPATANADPNDATYQTQAWLMIKANLPVARMTALERYVTARTQVYRLQSVGRLSQGGPVVRMEAVIDANITNTYSGTTNGLPRILMMRPLSDLGPGYDLNMNQ